MHNAPGEVPITNGVRFNIEAVTAGKADARGQHSITP
jgi:hypothetical protein